MLVSMREYALAQGRHREGTASKPWLIAISTLRDIFIINAVYVTVDLVRGAVQYRPETSLQSPNAIVWINLFLPFLELFLFGLIAFIVLRRIFLLRAWLVANEA